MTAPIAVSACDYAGCTRISDSELDGWRFCRGHLLEHRRLRREDAEVRTARGPLPPPAESWLSARYGGRRLPSQSWDPILEVMARYSGVRKAS